MNKLKWRFPLSNHGTRIGFNDAGIENFTGSEIKSLAREIIQNSLDAKNYELFEQPVIVEFSQFELDGRDFPDIDNLKDALNKSSFEANKLKDKKPSHFFNRANKIISAEKIPFLRISDFNTLGLKGVNDKDSTPWNNLVRSQGISDKSSLDGGSFGIGKNAAFACSSLRTVIYSTLTVDGEVGTQGVSSLISFDNEEFNDHTQGTGYLGVSNKNYALEELKSFDEKFQREKPGTDIFISGFYTREDVKDELTVTILDNFFYAIYKNNLNVIINNVKINSLNLKSNILKYKNEIKETTYELYRLFFEEDVNIYYDNIYGLEKDIEIRILLDDDGSRKVSMIRKPWMKIKEADGFPRRYKFFGAVIIKGDKLNALLRKTENPQHDNWVPNKIKDDDELRNLAATMLKKIDKAVKDKLEKLHEVDLKEYSDIFGAGDYIELIDSVGATKAQGKVKDVVKYSKLTKTSTLKEGQPTMEVTEGEFELEIREEGDEIIYADPEPYKDHSKNKFEDFEEELRSNTIKITKRKEDIRILSKERKNGWFRLIIKSDKDAMYHLKLNILDEQALVIKDAIVITDSSLKNNDLLLKNYLRNVFLEKGYNTIDIKINHNLNVSIGVEIYEIQR